MRISGWLMLVIIAVVILAAAGAAVLTVSWLGPVGGERRAGVNLEGDPMEIQSPEPFGPIYDAGTFTVNLVSNSRSRFLRARISVEVDGRKALEELQTREPAVRDAIIATLRSYTPAQLADADGIAALKEQLEQVLSDMLPEGRVKRVYFQEFITQ